jgi:divalent metal cation (Fe/Co/Zn/Cd) transporter
MNLKKLWRWAYWAALITIFYNILEGVISVSFGYSDETLSLFGFGLDSFVEVISGLGVLRMIIRTDRNQEKRDQFEKTALKITGTSFYLLTAGLIITAILNIVNKSQPSTTFWGIVISIVSIFTMSLLVRFKMSIGKKLNSDSLLSDANCTKTCIYLSIVLLVASILFEVVRIGYVDSIGALGIAYYAFKEGREAFGKAKGKSCDCC